MTADGKSEAGFAVAAPGAGFGLRERLAQSAELLLGHPDPGVTDGERYPVVGAALDNQADRARRFGQVKDVDRLSIQVGSAGTLGARLGRLALELTPSGAVMLDVVSRHRFVPLDDLAAALGWSAGRT